MATSTPSSLFHSLATLADELAATASRLKKRAAIAQIFSLLQATDPTGTDAGLFGLYLGGTAFAETDRRKLNVGGAQLSNTVSEMTGATQAAFHEAYRRHGDLGAAAFDLLAGKAPGQPTLSYADVAEAFAQIATTRNSAARQALVLALLRRATALEAKYLIKLMLGDMRIGVKQSLIEEALAVASAAPLADVRHALMLEGDILSTVRRAFAQTLHEATMRLFHPLGFMLASPVKSAEEAVERFTAEEQADGDPHVEAYLEDKFDGMRAQIHCGDATQPGRVAIFSRNREDVTESFPELAEAFASVQRPLILDGEILAWDVVTARALPFTILSQRIGRKRVTDAMRTQMPVVFMAFDLIAANGALTLELPLRKRRAQLEVIAAEIMPATRSALDAPADQGGLFATESIEVQRLILSAASVADSAEGINRAYDAARERGNEGVMIKAAASIYQPGRRGIAWVKLKRELATLDVVITAAEYGHGRRNAVLSDYTFAIRDDDEFKNVGKAYSGLNDAEIAELTTRLIAETIEDRGSYRVVEPKVILEVAFNNVMRSLRHASGFALRFPRILRIRTDKPLEEIDTLARVEEIYQSQPDKPVE
ncbi:MAG TPA: ATP-dependent DNA ligase [Acidobacteriaceae bacterium]